MRKENVQEYYEKLKYYYLKPDSDWTDKAKSIRTVAHSFYMEATRTYGKFADALKEFYKWSKYNEVSQAAFCLKDKLNDVVHHNKVIEKSTYLTYYNMLVRLIYLATGVLPDQATMEYIGCVKSDELSGLNDEQKDAVLCDDQIIYVSAGPGTGKTHLLINKLLHYINISTATEKIVALSYTNTASNELGDKFRKAAFDSGITKLFEFHNGTLHSFCYKMMRSYYSGIGKEFNYIVIDDTDIEDLAEEFRIQFNDLYKKDEIKACLKSNLKSDNPELQRLISDLKNRYNIISIDDILTNFIDDLSNDGFRNWIKGQVSVLVIDEAQDLTELNYKIFDLLLQVNPTMKMFLVGDSRQNIFGFNGGSYEHLDQFLQRHHNYTRKNLTGSYRCPQPVCNYVNTFHFIDCENTPLRSVGGTEGRLMVLSNNTVNNEAYRVIDIVRQISDLNNTAVLCNTLKYLETFIAALGGEKIPYKVFGGQKMVKMPVKLFNHLLRIIDADNAYSIKSINSALRFNSEKMAGKNATERFYNTPGGQFLKDIKDEIARNARIKEDVSMRDIASTLVQHFFSNADQETQKNLFALVELAGQYNSIADYLLSFSIDREKFAVFMEKNYVECKVPVSDEFLTVSTIHYAKGLEWKNVIVMGLSEGNFPNPWFDRNKSEAEKAKSMNNSLKAMFVAATRTKGNLYLTYSKKNQRGFDQFPSRFLRSIS